jgi:chromosome segregation protein
LDKQRENLIKVVENLNARKKEGLLKVFGGVNENFKRIYKELSNGGTAELSLENPELPFEGGLIIRACPPGKKVLRLEAISGGEQSLVALALIFAIQQYQPSPFYVLDEVDMHLDAINAERVARMIKRNSKDTQFIIVTLKNVALKEADHIYGVTVQTNGITDIIGNVNISSMQSGDGLPPRG